MLSLLSVFFYFFFFDQKKLHNYYIKITDGNYIVNQWIEIPKVNYKQEDNYIVRFYVFDETGSEYFLID